MWELFCSHSVAGGLPFTVPTVRRPGPPYEDCWTMAWTAPIEHNAVNVSDCEVRVLEIEYKQPAPPPEPGTAGRRSRSRQGPKSFEAPVRGSRSRRRRPTRPSLGPAPSPHLPGPPFDRAPARAARIRIGQVLSDVGFPNSLRSISAPARRSRPQGAIDLLFRGRVLATNGAADDRTGVSGYDIRS